MTANQAPYGKLQIVLMLHIVDCVGFEKICELIDPAKLTLRTHTEAVQRVRIWRTIRTAMMSSARYRSDHMLITEVFRRVGHAQRAVPK